MRRHCRTWHPVPLLHSEGSCYAALTPGTRCTACLDNFVLGANYPTPSTQRLLPSADLWLRNSLIMKPLRFVISFTIPCDSIFLLKVPGFSNLFLNVPGSKRSFPLVPRRRLPAGRHPDHVPAAQPAQVHPAALLLLLDPANREQCHARRAPPAAPALHPWDNRHAARHPALHVRVPQELHEGGAQPHVVHRPCLVSRRISSSIYGALIFGCYFLRCTCSGVRRKHEGGAKPFMVHRAVLVSRRIFLFGSSGLLFVATFCF